MRAVAGILHGCVRRPGLAHCQLALLSGSGWGNVSQPRLIYFPLLPRVGALSRTQGGHSHPAGNWQSCGSDWGYLAAAAAACRPQVRMFSVEHGALLARFRLCFLAFTRWT